jgi:hypothetical protein
MFEKTTFESLVRGRRVNKRCIKPRSGEADCESWCPRRQLNLDRLYGVLYWVAEYAATVSNVRCKLLLQPRIGSFDNAHRAGVDARSCSVSAGAAALTL